MSLTIVTISRAANDPNYCYSSDATRPQLGLFSTKTSYESVRGSSVNPHASSKYMEKIILNKSNRFKKPI